MSKTEQRAAETILEKGVFFRVPNAGIMRYFKDETTFILKQPNAGTLLKISQVAASIEIDEDKITENPIFESWQITKREIVNVTRIVAIAILGTKWRIFFLTGILTRYLMWRVTPSKLIELAKLMIQLCNTADFLNSIRLIRGTRITSPKNLSPVDQGG